jgi:hypothetical protein
MKVDDRVQVNGTSQGIIVKKQGRKFRILLDGQTKETWVNDEDLKVLDESITNAKLDPTNKASDVADKMVKENTPSAAPVYAEEDLQKMLKEELVKTYGVSTEPQKKPSVVVSPLITATNAVSSPQQKPSVVVSPRLITPPGSPKGKLSNGVQTGDENVFNDCFNAFGVHMEEIRKIVLHVDTTMNNLPDNVKTGVQDILLAQQEKEKSTPRALLPSNKVILTAAVGTLALTLCLYLCAQPYFTPGVWLHNTWMVIVRSSYDVCQAICDTFLAMWNTVATLLYIAMQCVSAWLSSVNSGVQKYLSEARVGLASTLRSWADWLAVSKPIDVDVIPEAVTITDTNATATLTNATATLTNATFTTLNTWPTSRYIATVGLLVAVPAQVPLIGVGACAIGLIEAVPQVAAMVKDTLL